MSAAHGQASYDVRFEWGPTGAQAIAGHADVALVVDVLSFTTTLTIAAERGIPVLPYRWNDHNVTAFAREHDATVAIGRAEAARDGRSGATLSPASLRTADVKRLVLPSPNGSSICALLAGAGVEVVAGALRNAAAVSAWVAPRLAAGARVAVVAAGERWPDGSLRPAVEDLWGAGALLAELERRTEVDGFSPEARVARDAFSCVRERLLAELLASASGRELVDAGFGEDVEVAADLDATTVVPVLVGGEFLPSGGLQFPP